MKERSICFLSACRSTKLPLEPWTLDEIETGGERYRGIWLFGRQSFSFMMTCACMQVTGFVFLDEDATSYSPPPDLAAFLAPPYEPPIYIGFGSLVLTVPAFPPAYLPPSIAPLPAA